MFERVSTTRQVPEDVVLGGGEGKVLNFIYVYIYIYQYVYIYTVYLQYLLGILGKYK